MLKPLAPTLKELDLSYNELGGTITDDIEDFTTLTKLKLCGMDLKGRHPCAYDQTCSIRRE